MRRRPRDPRQPLFGRALVGLSLLQGASVLAILVVVFVATLWRGKGEAEARALTFTTLIVASLALLLANRSWRRTMWETLGQPNQALWWVVGGAIALLSVVLYVPPLRAVFRFATLHGDDLLVCVGAGAFGVLWFEALKVIRRRRPSEYLGTPEQ